MLAHAASSMGATAAENAMNGDKKFPFHLIPRGIWSVPEVGAVGLTEKEAKALGKEIKVAESPYSINGLATARNEVQGTVKIIADALYGEILGVHMVGAHATELVGEAVMAMQLEATVKKLAHSIHVHPTFSEILADAAENAGK